MFYSEYFDGERESWEIVRASYGSRPILLQSFFRTGQMNRNNECSMQCCEKAGYTYFEVEPRSYIVDGDDVFVSWDGFYQDCNDEFASRRDLQWSIGVSKIIQSPECVLTDGLEPVRFEDCTSPVSIVYQGGSRARETLLGYSGMAVSRSPSGKRVFYLSVIQNIFGVNGAGAAASSEVWTMPEGEQFSKNPMAVQKFGTIQVAKEFLEHPVDDVGTIRLRLNDDGIPTAACRTAYDAGVFCYALEMKDESNINVIEQKEYVTPEQISESCALESSHYPITKILPPVSTGLEVFWREDSPDEIPEMLFFGCYGEINGLGNFSTAFSNGTIHETIRGGHPGTILFGPDVAPPPEPLGDYIAPGLLGLPASDNSRKGARISRVIGLLAFATLVFSLYFKKRNRGRWCAARHQQRYELVEGDAYLSFPSENPSTSSYIELA
jgi:hypothetical protein